MVFTEKNELSFHKRWISFKLTLVHLVLAVKFGRMSKKQREKVEDEVRMHKQLQDHVPQPTSMVHGSTSPDVYSPHAAANPDYSVPASAMWVFDHGTPRFTVVTTGLCLQIFVISDG